MAWPSPQSRLERYLDPSAEWSAADDAALRRELGESAERRADYDRAVTLHRLMVGADPELPSGFERERMLSAVLEIVLDGVAAAEAPSPSLADRAQAWLRPLLAVGVAAAVALVLLPTDVFDDADYIGSRGGDEIELSVGIGVSGVTADSQEYEVAVAGTSLFYDDYLRIYTTREAETKTPYAFVFGLQQGRDPIWYAPDPEHEGGMSLEAELGRGVPLGGVADPIEFALSGGRHEVGDLTIVAIFTEEPIGLEDVRFSLSGELQWIPLEARLRNVPGVGYSGIIRILRLSIEPGSRGRP